MTLDQDTAAPIAAAPRSGAKSCSGIATGRGLREPCWERRLGDRQLLARGGQLTRRSAVTGEGRPLE